MQLDTSIFYFFNNLVNVNSYLDSIFLFSADYLDLVLVLSAILFLFFHDDFPKLKYFSKKEFFFRLKRIVFIFLISTIAWVFSKILKEIIARPRPFIALDNVNLLFQHGALDSFPSGHATFFMALSVAMYFINKKLGIYFGIGAILIGISRIIVGIHFPFDILFGFALGGLISFAIWVIYRKIENKM